MLVSHYLMCGIVGISHSSQASLEVFQALLMLQHRGQDSAGILSFSKEDHRFHIRKSLGLVSQVFDSFKLEELQGNFALGHTRYSTIGEIKEGDVQPMFQSFPYGIGAVHNGNISNFNSVKEKLFSERRYLQSDNDLEAIIHLLAQGIQKYQTGDFFPVLCKTVRNIFEWCEGGYSVISVIGEKGMIAFRDPFGIRPLVLGKRGESWMFASETNALTFLGYSYERDVEPGELIWIDLEGKLYSEILTKEKSKPCMFEWVYFSSAESSWQDRNVYETRLQLGNRLAEKVKLRWTSSTQEKIDLVTPVPDTSRSSAIALAEALSLPYREVLIKNRYVQRSFILNSPEKRRRAVNLKFSVIRSLVEGKNLLLVDDSIVRGTTSKKIIDLLRSYGANKIFVASTCPPIRFPCFYGIDFPKQDELIASNLSEQKVAQVLGADDVIFTDLNDLKQSLGLADFCHACLTGEYSYEKTHIPRLSQGRLPELTL